MSLDLLQFIERNQQRRVHLLAAGLGAFVTLVVWWVHVEHPGAFPDPVFHGFVNIGNLVFVIAPPFVTVFCIGHIFFKPLPGAAAGPMSSYLKHQESTRRW